MHDICPFAKNPCRGNLNSAKRKQFTCAKNLCFTVNQYSFRMKMLNSISMSSSSRGFTQYK